MALKLIWCRVFVVKESKVHLKHFGFICVEFGRTRTFAAVEINARSPD